MPILNTQDFTVIGATIQTYLREQGVFITQPQARGVVGLLLAETPAQVQAVSTAIALGNRKQQLVQFSFLLGRPAVQEALQKEGLRDAAALALADIADLLPSSALQSFDVDTLLAILTALEQMTRPELDLPEDHSLRLKANYVETMLSIKGGYDEEVANRLSAQFSAFTGREGAIARALYREFGWPAACARLLSEYSFEAAIGPVCLWSEKEQAHWVHPVGWARDGWSATGYLPEDRETIQLKTSERWVPWTSLSKELRAGPDADIATESAMTVHERAVFRFGIEELRQVLAAPEPSVSESMTPEDLIEARVRRRLIGELLAAKLGEPSSLTDRLVAQVPLLVPTLTSQDVRSLVESRGFDATLLFLNTEFRAQPMLGTWLRCSRQGEQFVAVDGSWTLNPWEAAGYHEKDCTELDDDQFWYRVPRTSSSAAVNETAP